MSMDSLHPADGQPIAAFSQPLDQKQMVAGQEQLTLADKVNIFVEDFDFSEAFNIDTSIGAIAEQSTQVSADISKLTEQLAQVSADISELVETRQEAEQVTVSEVAAVNDLASFLSALKDMRIFDGKVTKNVLHHQKQLSLKEFQEFAGQGHRIQIIGDDLIIPEALHGEYNEGDKITILVLQIKSFSSYF
jgi:hypothetical protein